MSLKPAPIAAALLAAALAGCDPRPPNPKAPHVDARPPAVASTAAQPLLPG